MTEVIIFVQILKVEERGRIIYGLMHRVMQGCERFSFLWVQEEHTMPFCRRAWGTPLTL